MSRTSKDTAWLSFASLESISTSAPELLTLVPPSSIVTLIPGFSFSRLSIILSDNFLPASKRFWLNPSLPGPLGSSSPAPGVFDIKPFIFIFVDLIFLPLACLIISSDIS